jgi:NADH dehydrogenase
VGAGFGGLAAAQALAKAPVDVTLVDRTNHHLFQPLLYQVATAGLSPADIAVPIRQVLRRQRNVRILMTEVTGVDRAGRRVLFADGSLPFDELILATGSTYHYFGRPEWERAAPSLKTLADATAIRQRILSAFERAEMESDADRKRALMTFVVVGGGPTGVEMAGAIAELAHKALAGDFRSVNPSFAQILLCEAGPRILPSFSEGLSAAAASELDRLGVEVLVGRSVESVDAAGVVVGGRRIEAATVIWCAGVLATPVGRWLGVETDRQGRVRVNPDLSVPGFEGVYVIGDSAAGLPALAPVAMQQGRYVAGAIREKLAGRRPAPFTYLDKGNLATVGRSFAVAEYRGLRWKGSAAWLLWLVVHIYYLITFRNRFFVLLQWAWAYVTFQRGARLIVPARRSDS